MPCHCQDCSDDPKPTWTEEYKYACYIRDIASRDEEDIKGYLDLLKKNHGLEKWKKVRADVIVEYRKK